MTLVDHVRGQSDRWTLRSATLAVCAAAFVLSFVEPNTRGMPVGNAQLGRMVPDMVTEFLRVASMVALLATLALAGVLLLRSVIEERSMRPALRSKWVTIAVGLMSVAVVIGAIRGILGDAPTRHALSHGQFIVPYVLALGLPIPTRTEWDRLLHAVRIGFTVPAVYSAVVMVLGLAEPPAWYARIIPNGTSFTGIACILWLAHARTTGRLRWYGLASLCGTALVVSGSRGWVAALLVALGIYAFVSRGSHPRLQWRDAAAASVSAAIGLLVTLRFRSAELLVNRTVATSSSDRRVDQARNLLEAVSESPLLGDGLGVRDPALARGGPGGSSIARPYLVELSYLNLLAKMGLIGFGLLMGGLVMLLWLQRDSARVPEPNATMAAGFAGTCYLLLSSLGNPSFESVYFHFFIAVIVVGALGWRERARAVSMPDHEPARIDQ